MMIQFPVFKTKIKGVTKRFDLNNPKGRKEYFSLKAGREIKEIRDYLKKGKTFIAYLVGKKNSGKGTYAKMFDEVVDPKRIEHFSIGDMIREVDEELKDKQKRKKLIAYLEKKYRGWHSVKELIALLEKRSTKTLLPTELILDLVKKEIQERKKKAIFIDGFPRDLDQINFTLFFRDLIGYRDDPDIFVLIDVPEKVIDERIKWRRICPVCKTSRGLTLLPTSKIGYDAKQKNFYLICDNSTCRGTKMIAKEGDELGTAPIKERLKKDEKLIEQAFHLYGIPKVLLRNSLPAKDAKKYVDDYEITPEYVYKWDEKTKKVKIIEKPWLIKDDRGVKSVSLLAPAVVVSLIKQMAGLLKL
ncbi:MAG: nucleoside monophosphate kinase [Patescibacteria group bacterium]